MPHSETGRGTPEVRRPRRALLFVPGSALRDPDHELTRFARHVMGDDLAPALRPDTLILDLEDSVSPAHKAEARGHVLRFLESVVGSSRVEVVLRINTDGSHVDDRELEIAAGPGVDSVMVPKTDPDNHEALVKQLSLLGKPLLPIVESAAAFDTRNRILGNFVATSEATRIRGAAVLGLDDFCADLRINRDVFMSEPALSSMLGLFVTAGRHAGLPLIGPVYNTARDSSGAEQEARFLARIGFTGTLCVFPPYVRGLKRAFTPVAEEVERARDVIEDLAGEGRKGFGWVVRGTVKYDLADLPYLHWVVAHAAACREMDE